MEESADQATMIFNTLLLLTSMRSTFSAILFLLDVDETKSPENIFQLTAVLGAIFASTGFALFAYGTLRFLRNKISKKVTPNASSKESTTTGNLLECKLTKCSEALEDLTGCCDKLEKHLDQLIITGENISFAFERMKSRPILVTNLERLHKLRETDIINNIQVPSFQHKYLVVQQHSQKSTSSEDTDVFPEQHNTTYNLIQLTPSPRNPVPSPKKSVSPTRETALCRRKSTDSKNAYYPTMEVLQSPKKNAARGSPIKTPPYRGEAMQTPPREIMQNIRTKLLSESSKGNALKTRKEAALSPRKESVRKPRKESVRKPRKESVRKPRKESVQSPRKEAVQKPRKEAEKTPRETMHIHWTKVPLSFSTEDEVSVPLEKCYTVSSERS